MIIDEWADHEIVCSKRVSETNKYEIQNDVIFQIGDKIDSSYIEFIVEENTKLKAEIEQLKTTISKMESTTVQEDDLK